MDFLEFDLSEDSLEDLKHKYEQCFYLAAFTLNKIERVEPVYLNNILADVSGQLSFRVSAISTKESGPIQWHTYYSFNPKQIKFFDYLPEAKLFNHRGFVFELSYTPKRQFRQGFNTRTSSITIPNSFHQLYHPFFSLRRLHDMYIIDPSGSGMYDLPITQSIFKPQTLEYSSITEGFKLLKEHKRFAVAISPHFYIMVNPLYNDDENILLATANEVIGYITDRDVFVYKDSRGYLDLLNENHPGAIKEAA